jgi:hypothetical protein
MGGTVEAHPGHIHSGTCDELGDVVFPLEDATSGGAMGTPMAGMDAGAMATPGAGMGGETYRSVTEVEAALDDILAAEHAINFHESAENIETYVACGDLTGHAGGRRARGRAGGAERLRRLGPGELEDNGDGTTTVTVELEHAGMGTMATPEA